MNLNRFHVQVHQTMVLKVGIRPAWITQIQTREDHASVYKLLCLIGFSDCAQLLLCPSFSYVSTWFWGTTKSTFCVLPLPIAFVQLRRTHQLSCFISLIYSTFTCQFVCRCTTYCSRTISLRFLIVRIAGINVTALPISARSITMAYVWKHGYVCCGAIDHECHRDMMNGRWLTEIWIYTFLHVKVMAP